MGTKDSCSDLGRRVYRRKERERNIRKSSVLVWGQACGIKPSVELDSLEFNSDVVSRYLNNVVFS